MIENHRQIQAVHAARVQRNLRGLWDALEKIVDRYDVFIIPDNPQWDWMKEWEPRQLVHRFPKRMISIKNYLEKCNEQLSIITRGSLDSQDHNVAIQMARRHFNSAKKVIEQITEAYPELLHEFAPIEQFLKTLWDGTVRRVK